MPQNVNSYLENTLPLKGVNARNLYLIGKPSLEILIKFFKYKALYGGEYSEMDKSTAWYLRKHILGKVPPCSNDYPVLPCIRNEFYLSQGDEVVLYVGTQSERYWEVGAKDRYGWIYGRVHRVNIGLVEVFTNQALNHSISEYEGHMREIDLESPILFKRDEFVKFRRKLGDRKDNKFLDFWKIFELNCMLELSKWKNPHDFNLHVIHSPVEAFTEAERKVVEEKLLSYVDKFPDVNLKKSILQVV
jgi:hypothetical protein